MSCCPVASRSPKSHRRHQSWCKEAWLTVLQWGVPVMNCMSLASSEWTARLGHSLKSCESACPYLVQGTHSFKGNGKGWSLQRCQSRVTQTSYYTIYVYIESSSDFFCFAMTLILTAQNFKSCSATSVSTLTSCLNKYFLNSLGKTGQLKYTVFLLWLSIYRRAETIQY